MASSARSGILLRSFVRYAMPTNEQFEKILKGWGRWVPAALFLTALIIFLAGNGTHSLWDRDETRYSEATRAMIVNGDWVVPMFNGDIRFDKPIMIYWLMSTSMKVFGINEFGARAAQSLAGSLFVLVIFHLAGRMGASLVGRFLSALFAMGFILLMLIGKAATTDAWLTLTVVTAYWVHWEQRERGFGWGRHVAFWALIGFGALVKGPVAWALIGFGVIGERVWVWWANRGKPGTGPGAAVAIGRFAAGVAVMLAVTMPWVAAVWDRTNGEFLEVALGRHVLERSLEPINNQGGMFLYYFPVLLITTFPFTAAMLLGLHWAWRDRRNHKALPLLWCWLVFPFIMFSLVSTKLPHYIAPLLPSVAIMIGLWWTRFSAGEYPAAARGWWIAGALFVGVLGGLLGIGLPVAAYFINLTHIIAPFVALGILLAVSTVTGAVCWWRREPLTALLVWWVGIALFMLVTALWGLRAMEPLRPTKPVIEWIRQNAPENVHFMAADYREPSLVFYWGGLVEMLGNSDHGVGVERFASDRPTAMVTYRSRWEGWQRYQSTIADHAEVLYEQRYFVPQRGRWVDMVIVGNWEMQGAEEPRAVTQVEGDR